MKLTYIINKHEHTTTFNIDNYADVTRANLLMRDLQATRIPFRVDYL